MSGSPARYIADLDSTTSMLYALAQRLRHRGFAGGGALGMVPPFMARLVNALPDRSRDALYRLAGWWEAIAPNQLATVRSRDIAAWVVRRYGEGPYPGAAIGSPNGAAIHLCSAMHLPWLPQTFLVPVRRRADPDEPWDDLTWGRNPARLMLETNPDLQLHQMHDPVQDRLMLSRMAYFRVKLLRLEAPYEQFLRRTLLPGAIVLLVDCRFRWPATAVQERHFFQTGGFGGPSVEEYLHGGKRVEEFLRRYGSRVRRWSVPEPTNDVEEAEWGFVPSMAQDVRRFARSAGYQIRRLTFHDPQHLSPLIADLYRWWYRQRGLDANRLLIDCFALIEPWWVLRTGSVPYWLTFTTDRSAESLEHYLEDQETFDDMYLMLLSNGVNGIGLAPLERWNAILARARRRGRLLGVDPAKFPRDVGSFLRYHRELKRQIRTRVAVPAPLTVTELDRFLTQSVRHDAIQYTAD